MSFRTQQAVKQAVYSRLTSPPITYAINASSPITLTAANVVSRAVWIPAVGGQPQAISPYIAFSVGGRAHEKLLAERDLKLKIWVSSNSLDRPDAEVTEVYEAVRALLHGADDEATSEWLQMAPPSLTRADGEGILGCVVRRCREVEALDADYEPNSARWYISATYRVVAV
jgi:hypothetical protein